MNDINEQSTQTINPNKKDNNVSNTSNNFNLIIGIATLLIALLGATFAYFSATARSKENDVTVKSAYVSISYDGGTEIKATNLIPSTLTVALNKYQKDVEPYDPETDGEINTDYDAYLSDIARRCVDAKGKEVCYVYQFTIESDGIEGGTTDIVASIKINNNQFTNLSYMLYEVKFKEENGEPITDKYGFKIVDKENGGYGYVKNNFPYTDTNPDNVEFQDRTFDKFKQPRDIKGESGELLETVYPVACLFGYVDNTEGIREDDTKICKPQPIENKVSHTYQLLIWLEETGEEQPEQGLSLEGTVNIEVSGGFDGSEYDDGKITGRD